MPRSSASPARRSNRTTPTRGPCFGEYVSVYDLQQPVIDKATVPIYYESRIAKLSLNEAEVPKVDSEFAEITAGEEEDRKQKLKTKWAALEALVGSEKRIRLIAEDLVQHFERRLEAVDGKATREVGSRKDECRRST
jgi:type I restriction enzyme R subunit